MQVVPEQGQSANNNSCFCASHRRTNQDFLTILQQLHQYCSVRDEDGSGANQVAFILSHGQEQPLQCSNGCSLCVCRQHG